MVVEGWIADRVQAGPASRACPDGRIKNTNRRVEAGSLAIAKVIVNQIVARGDLLRQGDFLVIPDAETATTTVPLLAARLGRAPSAIRGWCQRMGLPRVGRDYVLTQQQAAMVTAKVRDHPGRPPKEQSVQ